MKTDEQKWVIVDLDGTVANCKHRVDHAQIGEWDEFQSKLHLDTVYEDVALLLKILAEYDNITVIALTGRGEKYRQATNEWLQANGIAECFSSIVMRPNENFEKDFIFKTKALEELFGSKENMLSSVAFILEDRDPVVEALRDYGLNVWQVRQGDY